MSYRLVLFDFDGTLADSYPLFAEIVNALADEFGFRKMEEHEVDSLRRVGARQVSRHLGVPMWKMPAIARSMRRRLSEVIDRVPLFDGVDEMLRRLASRGIAIAVVTSNSEKNVRRALGPENAALVDYYECDVGVFGKRAALRRALERSGVPAREALCVGDEIRDAEAARQAGIPFAGVAWGYTVPEALGEHSPVALFATVREIADRLA
jgi:phosphoglycolate phosphatase